MNYDGEDIIAGCAGPLLAMSVGIACMAAWLTHVVVCIQNESWLFLIAGAIAAPVAVVHGFGCWFGLWS